MYIMKLTRMIWKYTQIVICTQAYIRTTTVGKVVLKKVNLIKNNDKDLCFEY